MMMVRHACCILVLISGMVSFCAAEENSQTPTKESPYVFCVDNYGAIRVDAPQGASVKLLQGPKGMDMVQPGGVLFWAPTEKQIGEHTVRVFVMPQKGQPIEKEYHIVVKPLQRVLCVFAHSDDEFGIVAKMKRMADCGVEVWAVWTCGGNKVRDAESMAAMMKIGLAKKHLIFQSYGNYKTPDGLRAKITPLVKLLKNNSFDQIYVDAFEGGHTQHDMSSFIAAQATRQADFRGQVYEFPLYNMAGGKPTMFTLIPAAMPTVEMTLSKPELDFVVSLVPCYPSQKAITMGFLVGMSHEQKTHPRYRPRPNWDYTRRPHPGTQLFEVKPDEKMPKFNDRIHGPATAYFKANGGNKGSIWEQDRNANEKAMSNKIFTDPYVVKKKGTGSR